MQQYNTGELRKQFTKLTKIKDTRLYCVLDGVFNEWVASLPLPPITDIKKDKKPYPFCPHDSYACVIDGKIVKIDVKREDIVTDDEDEFDYKAEEISFTGGKKEEETAFKIFGEFVGKKSLEELVKIIYGDGVKDVNSFIDQRYTKR